MYDFRLYAGESFSTVEAARIRLLFDSYCAVSFNGNYYDVPMITSALSGYTAEQLKWQNDLIIVEKVKPWELGLPDWKPSDHIDIMEVAPGAGSQNQYAGRIHYKTMQDLPYDPAKHLTLEEIPDLDEKCENDLLKLEAIFDALQPQVKVREALSARHGMDLRSKSDAQLAEAILKKRCEQALGYRIYKPEVDWNLKFRYKVPDFIAYTLPQLQNALSRVRESIFGLGSKGTVEMPPQLEGLEIAIGQSVYKVGIGGLHSQEKRTARLSTDTHVLRDNDVASYYPSLMINSGEFPPALGPMFLEVFSEIKDERLAAKELQKRLGKEGFIGTVEYIAAETENEGGKVQINGTFGKTGSPYSVLFAPTMLIQTTITGQLSLLMLIEWHEAYGIPVVSANTDGIVINCPRNMVHVSEALIAEWQKRTGLEMETVEYRAIYSRDINNYFAVKANGEVKRKGEYSKGGLVEKKNPDVEICSDAVADYLANGVPIEYTIAACRDIRKFVTIQKVGDKVGGVKMWGDGPRKGARVMDMTATLAAGGWVKEGRKWRNGDLLSDAFTAYASCFKPQRPEYLGKVVRWYYSTQAPGPIVYATNGNTVSLSYGARPCMVLPDEFPVDIDYDWYIKKAESILVDIGK